MGQCKRQEPLRPERLRWMRVMRQKGYSLKQIGDTVGVTKQAVKKYLKRWENWEDKKVSIGGFTLTKTSGKVSSRKDQRT